MEEDRREVGTGRDLDGEKVGIAGTDGIGAAADGRTPEAVPDQEARRKG